MSVAPRLSRMWESEFRGLASLTFAWKTRNWPVPLVQNRDERDSFYDCVKPSAASTMNQPPSLLESMHRAPGPHPIPFTFAILSPPPPQPSQRWTSRRWAPLRQGLARSKVGGSTFQLEFYSRHSSSTPRFPPALLRLQRPPPPRPSPAYN